MALGIYPRTKEHGRNISKSKMGHEVSKETREKISKKLKGTRLGNTCGFKKGNVPWNYMGGIGKNYPNQKQVHNQRESIRNWCISNQIHRVPDSCLIHHIDQNPFNNNPNNLQLMDWTFHGQLHNRYYKLMKGDGIANAI